MYLREQPDHVFPSQLAKPVAVEAHLGLLRIEDLEDLRLVGFGVALDGLAGHRRTRDVAAGGVADHAGHVADQEDDGVAEVLKVLHLAQQHGVAQVQVGRGGIEPRFDAQLASGLFALDQALAQILFADDLRHPLPQVRELFVDGHGSACFKSAENCRTASTWPGSAGVSMPPCEASSG